MRIKEWQILTLLHMVVDGLCACCLFSLMPFISNSDVFSVFILYNCLAFLTQPITGLFVDTLGRGRNTLLLSVALLMIGGLCDVAFITSFVNISPFVFVSFLGMGNSLFHVYGGKYVTHFSGNDMRHLGIFVSTGALGLFLGGHVASVIGVVSVVLLLSLLTVLFVKVNKNKSGSYYQSSYRAENLDVKVDFGIPLFLFILLIVAFRSFLGKMIPSYANEIVRFPLYACLLAVCGKAFGGYVARWFGVGRTLFFTLILSGGCFLLGYYHIAFVMAMIMFINLSMPITLQLANRCFPKYEGFAFGMIAAFLIPGYYLGSFSIGNPLTYHLLYPLISTMIIEAFVLLLLKERRWKVLCSSVVINIMTNVPLNLYVSTLHRPLTWLDILLLEGIVVLVESLIYYIIVKDIRKSILYGILCNAVSYLIGFIYLSYF